MGRPCSRQRHHRGALRSQSRACEEVCSYLLEPLQHLGAGGHRGTLGEGTTRNPEGSSGNGVCNATRAAREQRPGCEWRSAQSGMPLLELAQRSRRYETLASPRGGAIDGCHSASGCLAVQRLLVATGEPNRGVVCVCGTVPPSHRQLGVLPTAHRAPSLSRAPTGAEEDSEAEEAAVVAAAAEEDAPRAALPPPL